MTFETKVPTLPFSMQQSHLEVKLTLHESRLLESQHLQAIALRLVNSFFMSNSEFDELLHDARETVKKLEQLTYVVDETIEHALREWFRRILFSATLGFVNGKTITEDILEGVKLLWEKGDFDRGQFIDKFDKWLRDCSRNRIKESISNQVIDECRAKKIDFKMPEVFGKTIDKMLLIDDREIKKEIITAVRERVM